MKNIFLFVAILFLFVGCEIAYAPDGEVLEKDEVGVEDGGEVDVVKLVEEPVDELAYVNDRYKFQLRFLPNFEVGYLSEETGVSMIRVAEYEDVVDNGEVVVNTYIVEITVQAYFNEEKYDDLSEFLAAKYDGYTKEFGENGVYVNEWEEGDSIRHFYLMSGDKKFIYDAYLKVPSPHYNKHWKWFDEFAESIELF